MKLSDVKVGMRVALLKSDGELDSFRTVERIHANGNVQFVGGGSCSAIYLRKVKPKRSVSFTTSVIKHVLAPKLEGVIAGAELAPLIGKRVRVTVKEIK